MPVDRACRLGGEGPIRVCVIGNSMVGAVLKAYRDRSPSNYSFHFFAHPGLEYEHIRFDGTTIVNVPFSSSTDFDMAHYDAFVVYGDLPTPLQAARYWRGLSPDLYSDQVRGAAFKGWLRRSKSMRIAQEVGLLTGRPVYCLSKNSLLHDDIGPKAEAEEGSVLLTAAMEPHGYIPHPDKLLNSDGRPDPAYYIGSLNVLGEEPDRMQQPEHHHFHFNREGGAIMLDQVIRWLGGIPTVPA